MRPIPVELARMPLPGLSGKVVIVTGGASGIGRAVVERLLAEGSNVALVDCDEEGVRAVCTGLDAERLLGVTADVSAVEDTDRYFAATLERFGRVDGLHANAGISEPGPTIAEEEAAHFDRTLAVNVRGVFLALRQMLRTLAVQGTQGSMVTTASVVGIKGWPNAGSYGASKAAVISLTKTAAIEAGPAGHRVNAVLPGPIDTPMAARIRAGLSPERQASFEHDQLADVQLGRFGQAQEVAALVAWLLSDESSYVTGGIYTVDGGQAVG
jgi:NAD(P)-dependent dehydrogenase (short-subunit alcohol dehydrogenase family)